MELPGPGGQKECPAPASDEWENANGAQKPLPDRIPSANPDSFAAGPTEDSHTALQYPFFYITGHNARIKDKGKRALRHKSN